MSDTNGDNGESFIGRLLQSKIVLYIALAFAIKMLLGYLSDYCKNSKSLTCSMVTTLDEVTDDASGVADFMSRIFQNQGARIAVYVIMFLSFITGGRLLEFLKGFLSLKVGKKDEDGNVIDDKENPLTDAEKDWNTAVDKYDQAVSEGKADAARSDLQKALETFTKDQLTQLQLSDRYTLSLLRGQGKMGDRSVANQIQLMTAEKSLLEASAAMRDMQALFRDRIEQFERYKENVKDAHDKLFGLGEYKDQKGAWGDLSEVSYVKGLDGKWYNNEGLSNIAPPASMDIPPSRVVILVVDRNGVVRDANNVHRTFHGTAGSDPKSNMGMFREGGMPPIDATFIMKLNEKYPGDVEMGLNYVMAARDGWQTLRDKDSTALPEIWFDGSPEMSFSKVDKSFKTRVQDLKEAAVEGNAAKIGDAVGVTTMGDTEATGVLQAYRDRLNMANIALESAQKGGVEATVLDGMRRVVEGTVRGVAVVSEPILTGIARTTAYLDSQLGAAEVTDNSGKTLSWNVESEAEVRNKIAEQGGDLAQEMADENERKDQEQETLDKVTQEFDNVEKLKID